MKSADAAGDGAAATARAERGGGGVRDCGGATVYLHANIELPEECGQAAAQGADGVGLFRTEFLFLHRAELPDEDEQFEVYRGVLRAMAPLPVVIRTLDAGADKMIAAADGAAARDVSPNPALGLRAIRYCLAHREIFLAQLRALLRANAECGNLKILVPMVSHPDEMQKTTALLATAREQVRALRGEAAAGAAAPALGGMIEVPAAVFIMRALARYLDFFSLGTNDLIQYMMALDRNDPTLAALYDPLHPAIAQTIAMIARRARTNRRQLTVCGEMAGDWRLTRLLLALGIRHLSASADKLARVRECVAQSDIGRLQQAAPRILRAATPADVARIVESINADLSS